MGEERAGNRTDGTGGGEERTPNPERYGRVRRTGEGPNDDRKTANPATRESNERYCPQCGAGIAEEAELCPECGVGLGNTTNGGPEQRTGEPSGRYPSAFVGGVVSFVVGWIPFVGPAVGGVAAGYLRGSDTKESAISGLIANVLASIPMMGLAALFLLFGGIGAVSEGDSDVALGLFLWALIFFASFVYFFVVGTAGGAIGAAITGKRAP